MALLIGSSCSKIELAPISTIATGSMWRTADDALSAKIGMYNLFRTAFADNYQWYTESRTGFYTFGRSFYERYRAHFDNRLDAASLGSDWTGFYTLINQCNLILKYVPRIDFADAQQQNQILAEAYFIRAYTYFWLVRIWGEIPVLTVPFESDDQENLYPVRDPESMAWDLIKSDLAEAESLYPAGRSQPAYLANLGAILMLKADVYLWLHKVGKEAGALTAAEAAINSVLSGQSYQLESSFRAVFREESNRENIFTIYREAEESGSSWFNLTIWRDGDVPVQYHNNPVPVGADNVYAFTDLAWNLLYEDPADQRAGETIDSLVIPPNRVFQWGVKYSGEYRNQRRWDQDQHVYRFAEALMFKAEIENEKGNSTSAIEFINRVAQRAYGKNAYYDSSLSKEEVDEVILKERAKEFFFEGRYWWDLIRFGKVFEKVPSLAGRENELNVLLWPVAYNTINRNNKIVQTPGY